MDKYSIKVFPPNSKTKEGYTSCFILSRDKKWLGYCSKKAIIIRNLDNFADCKIFSKHQSETTALTFFPDNERIASAEENGKVLIWKLSTLKIEKTIENAFPGQIAGLELNENSDKLLIYGKGGKNAKLIGLDDEKDKAFFTSTSPVLCGTYSPTDTFMIGNESGEIHFYEGCELKKTIKEHLTNKFITTILLSPDKSKFVTLGYDKIICTFDAKTGDLIEKFEANKVTDGHKLAIISAQFIDNDRIVTASLDKSLKVWNLKEKKVLFTLIPQEGKLDNTFKFCGVQTNGKKIVGLTLNGSICLWNVDSLSNNKTPDSAVEGHLGPISAIVYDQKSKEIFAGDTTGKIIIWKEDASSKIVYQNTMNYISALALNLNGDILYVADQKGNLIAFDKAALKEKFSLKGFASGTLALVPSRKNNEELWILASDSLVYTKNGQIVKKEKLTKPRAFDVNEDDKEILIADSNGDLHVFDMDLKEKNVVKNFLKNEATVLKISPDGKTLISSDQNYVVNIYDAKTKELKNKRLDDHKGKILCLDFTSDSKFLITSGFDGTVMVWDIVAQKLIKKFPEIDSHVSQVKYIDDKNIVCGGPSCAIKIINFE